MYTAKRKSSPGMATLVKKNLRSCHHIRTVSSNTSLKTHLVSLIRFVSQNHMFQVGNVFIYPLFKITRCQALQSLEAGSEGGHVLGVDYINLFVCNKVSDASLQYISSINQIKKTILINNIYLFIY